MVKKFHRRYIVIPNDLRDAGVVAPPTITSTTLFISIFFDGFLGPSFIIIPEKNIK
jgi:hypothetical protein